MSFHRIQKATDSFLKIKSVNSTFIYRSQSNSTARKGSGLRKAFFGFTLLSGGVVSGTIAYAAHNVEFKERVNNYVPGFSNVTDRSVILWNKGMGLASNGWETMKKIVLPEKTEKVQLPAPHPSPPTPSSQSPVVSSDKVSSQEKDQEDKKAPSISEPETPSIAPPTLEPVPPVVTSPEAAPSSDTIPTSTETTPTTDTSNLASSEVAVTSSETTPISKTTPIEDKVPSTPDVVPIATTPPSVARLQEVFDEYSEVSERLLKCFDGLQQSIVKYNDNMKKGIDNPPQDDKGMEDIVENIITCEYAVEEAREELKRSKERQNELSGKLTTAISEANNDGANDLVEMVCDKVAQYSLAVEKRENAVKEAEESTKVELQKLVQHEGEEDMALLNDKIVTLEKQIENMKEEEKKAMEQALSEKQNEYDEMMREKIREAIEEKEKQFQKELEEMEAELREIYEEKIKEQLYLQTQAQASYTKITLERQAEEISDELEEKHRKAEKEAEEEYHKKLAAAYAHLKGIESMINTVVEKSHNTRRQHSVRVASDALTNILISANNDANPYAKHSIKSEVQLLSEVAQDDTFIQTILSTIPYKALEDGISSEKSLKSRFDRVRRVARRVALVPEEGGGLGMYLLSFIQSLLTIDMIHPRLTSSGLSSIDPRSLSTFDLLHQAKVSLDAGDMETTVRVLGQLEGEARRVVSDWLRDALVYLETRQAVMAISEYLAASSAAILQ